MITALAAAAVTLPLLAVVPAQAPATATPAPRATVSRSTAPRATVVPARTATHDTLHWGRCPTDVYPDLAGDEERCAKLTVPMNYSRPHNGKTVTLEVSILRHTSSRKNYRGVVLTNPGGPGGGGLDLPEQTGPYVPDGVGADFDWIGWDPRGVGASTPTLHCQRDYFDGPRRSYDPTTKSLLRYWLRRSRAYAQACERKHPALLNNDTTKDSAEDMESIRKALGVAKIDYYGYSYGTYLGEVYSTLFPQHLRHMVLDSTVDPTRVWYRANLDQDKAFQRNIEIYFRWVARYDGVYHLGSTEKAVSKRYHADLAKLTRHPRGQLGPDEWNDAMEGAAYYRTDYRGLAYAWSAFAHRNDPAPMTSQYREADTPGDDNSFAGYNAVQCTDVQWPKHWSRWAKDNAAYNKKYPFLTWSNAWFNAPCLFWGARGHTPVTVNGKKTKSVLMIDEELDAATPFEGSLEVRRLYPNASLIAEPGGATHADSLFGDSCVDDKIATYLKTGKRPPRKPGNGPDVLCKPLPDPRG